MVNYFNYVAYVCCLIQGWGYKTLGFVVSGRG
jgi:hypothetical protein